MFLKSLLDHNLTLGILCTTATLFSISCVTYFIISDHHSKVQYRRDQKEKREISKLLSSHQEIISNIKDQIQDLQSQSQLHSLASLAGIEDCIMKSLESLDSIILSSSQDFDTLRDRKKTLIYNLQDHLKKLDNIQNNQNKSFS